MSASVRGCAPPSRPPTAGSFVALDSPRRSFFKTLNAAEGTTPGSGGGAGRPGCGSTNAPSHAHRGSTSTAAQQWSTPRASRPISGRFIPASDLLTSKSLASRTPPQLPPFGTSSPRTCMPYPKPVLLSPRQPLADCAEEIDRTINARAELEQFNTTIATGQIVYEKPIASHLLSKFLFRRDLALHTALAASLQALGQATVIGRFQSLSVDDSRVNMEEFHYVMCDLVRNPRLARDDADRIFQAMDFNGSGIVDSDEITMGLNILFRTREGAIAVFTKKTLDARAATDAFLSLDDVRSMLSAVASLCHGRYNGVQKDVDVIMAKLSPLARDSAVPVEWVQEFIASDAMLMSKVLSEMPRDGSVPTPAALGRLPSPDPDRDVRGIHAAVENKRRALIGGAPAAAAAGSTRDEKPEAHVTQETLQNTRFHADQFMDPGQKFADVPEHQKQSFYSMNGSVWKQTDRGRELV